MLGDSIITAHGSTTVLDPTTTGGERIVNADDDWIVVVLDAFERFVFTLVGHLVVLN